MRKYRGKRKDNGEWVYGWYHELDHGDHRGKAFIMPSHASALYSYEVDPETVGQYIGVHDDEGETEIFEGDNIRMMHEGEVITGNVQYCSGGFILASDDFEDGFAWISDLTENDGRYFWIPNSEVIGNRWSNPKLLGEVRE
ncbi:phage protein [Paenibacillus antibioticophila]|uniref:Phage protein n=1 Tax=Paenibacillus antibioticophila TaxID=1274374 RepID=A0A919XR58_9BACL|nr:YopX family protein [Paenibacillus antibioticophila]GIO36901.1 phage protein [Paenibacillus antibioticophila]